MTDKRIRLDCPFCGHSKEDIQIKTVGKFLVTINCPECMCQINGSSKQEVINKWNRRS